jgi:hypothetical protein
MKLKLITFGFFNHKVENFAHLWKYKDAKKLEKDLTEKEFNKRVGKVVKKEVKKVFKKEVSKD